MNHGVPQQVRQPPAIFVVRFVPFAILHFLRIRQVHLDRILQYVKHRLPVRAGAFHHHMGDPLLLQPRPQRFQFRSDRAELPDLDLGLPL
jgi:hypothetical protein